MNKIKIAYIIPSLEVGGSEHKVLELSNGIDKTKYEPIIITITKEGVLKELADSFNIPVISINKKSKFDIFALYRIKKVLKKNNVDIVQTFTSTGKLWGRIGAILAKTKFIISTEESLFRGKKLDVFFEKRLFKKTNLIICNSNSTKESAINKTKLDESKYYVIYNGINIDKFINNSIKDNNEIIKLIVVARLDKRKGIDLLIKALNLINKENINFHLNILGEGYELYYLKSLVHEFKLENKISFLGFKSNTEHYLFNSDIFVLPSREEGFGNSVIEAYASKVAVLTSNAGGLKEIVINDVTGLVFNNGDINDLYLKIKLLIKDKDLRDRISLNGFNEIKKYSSSLMINEHEKIYDKLVRGEKI